MFRCAMMLTVLVPVIVVHVFHCVVAQPTFTTAVVPLQESFPFGLQHVASGAGDCVLAAGDSASLGFTRASGKNSYTGIDQ